MKHYNSQRVTLDEDGVYMWCMNLIIGYVCFMISTLSPELLCLWCETLKGPLKRFETRSVILCGDEFKLNQEDRAGHIEQPRPLFKVANSVLFILLGPEPYLSSVKPHLTPIV